jgi:apolipoprotein D and lipocalin family protein
MRLLSIFVLTLSAILASCVSMPKDRLVSQSHVDLPRFMGDWYVIASIPTFLEKGAYNAVESYTLDPDGTIATTFTFRKGGFDGPAKIFKPRGFVRDESNAVWGMRFVWPIKAQYLITYLNEDYTQTIIARDARDFVWIMARTPHLALKDYQRLVTKVKDMEYDTAKLREVPQGGY